MLVGTAEAVKVCAGAITKVKSREEITRGRLIEKERKSQNTREAVRLKQRKRSVSRLGIEPRTTVYAPPCSDH